MTGKTTKFPRGKSGFSPRGDDYRSGWSTRKPVIKKGVCVLLALLASTTLFAQGEPTKGTIGIVLISTSDVNTVNAMNALAAAAKADHWKVLQADSQSSPDQANAAIQNYVQIGVNGLVATIYEPNSLQAGIQAANKAGIPVVGHFTGDGPGLAAWSSSADGVGMDQVMIKNLGGKGDILALTYHPGRPAFEREQILDKVLTKYPDIKVTKYETSLPDYLGPSADATRAWLATRPAGKTRYAVWACWDGPALGAITALKELNRHDVDVYGYNTDKDAQEQIRGGWLTADTWFDNVKVGQAEFQILKEAMAAGSNWKKTEIPASVVVVMKDNIDKWITDHPEVAQ